MPTRAARPARRPSGGSTRVCSGRLLLPPRGALLYALLPLRLVGGPAGQEPDTSSTYNTWWLVADYSVDCGGAAFRAEAARDGQSVRFFVLRAEEAAPDDMPVDEAP